MQFIDLHAQQNRLKAEIEAGIADVLNHGRYIFGPQVADFESKLAAFAQARHALSCANALGLVGTNEGTHDDEARIIHEARNLANAAYILNAVFLRETEIPVQAVTDIIAVERVCVMTAFKKKLIDKIGNRAFTRPG